MVAVPSARLEELDAAPQYSFAYDVQDAVTGDSKAQYETRNGDIVQGSYSLIEADGTRRIVQYTADPINGFNAVVSREPATAVAAIAAPLVPYTPAIVSSAAAAPVLPAAAPAPAIPASGPDSDVEVVEARSGPLVAGRQTSREEQLRRQQEQQLQQLKEIERQQQEQQQEQLQRLQRLQQRSRAQLQQAQQRQRVQGQEKSEEQGEQLQQQRQPQLQQQQLQQQQQQLQRQQLQLQQQQLQLQQAAPVRALAAPVQVGVKAQQLVGLPVAKAVATYPAAYAYTAAYSSPLAYAAPLNGLTYAPAAIL